MKIIGGCAAAVVLIVKGTMPVIFSKKFKWSSKEKGSRPARIPDTNARDQNEGEA